MQGTQHYTGPIADTNRHRHHVQMSTEEGI
jgi:hypothetical protein